MYGNMQKQLIVFIAIVSSVLYILYFKTHLM